jgi:hypothetical protein
MDNFFGIILICLALGIGAAIGIIFVIVGYSLAVRLGDKILDN